MNKLVEYRLLPYGRYTIPCLIKPGNLKEKYTIVWAQVSSGTLGPIKVLSTVNMTNFDLYQKEDTLPPSGMAVGCRVTIQHDSTKQGQYCGPRIAVAGTYISITVQLQGNPCNYPIYWTSFQGSYFIVRMSMMFCIIRATVKARVRARARARDGWMNRALRRYQLGRVHTP